MRRSRAEPGWKTVVGAAKYVLQVLLLIERFWHGL